MGFSVLSCPFMETPTWLWLEGHVCHYPLSEKKTTGCSYCTCCLRVQIQTLCKNGYNIDEEIFILIWMLFGSVHFSKTITKVKAIFAWYVYFVFIVFSLSILFYYLHFVFDEHLYFVCFFCVVLSSPTMIICRMWPFLYFCFVWDIYQWVYRIDDVDRWIHQSET